MKNWKTGRLGEVLNLNLDSVDVMSQTEFNFAGVYCFGKGLFKRGLQSGSDTSYKVFNRIHKNQIVISKVKGWEGAIALVTDDFEGMFLSPVYPTFNVISGKIADIRFVNTFLKQEYIWQKLLDSSKGIGARRNSISENQFLNLEILLPPLAEQQRIVEKLETVQKAVEKVRILRGEQERLVRNLMYSKYCELVENAEWRPMKEVAPIIRREVEINKQKSYAELGIRSFGKGTFHKLPLAGIDVGTKRLYAIKPKDLLFSNVFAWEGAIAVATANDDNRYGSHRFISCKTDENQAIPEFLCFHFLTEKGLEDINAASPGGAGRNKTLGLQKLEKIEVPIPPLSMQQDFIAIKAKLEALKIHQNTQLQAIEGLLPSMLDKAFKGEV